MVTSQNLAYESCFNVDTVGTLVDILHSKALYQPDKKAFTFLLDGETEETILTYQELDLQARAIATSLQNLGASGERALLIYPPGLEFIAAFLGCLYAGVVAVPAYPPRRNQSLSRLQSIVADAGATIALTTKTVLSNVERQFTQSPTLQALHWLATDNIASDLAPAWLQPAISSDTLAFLQYTSGSTGTPKGVMVSHGNLLHNEQMIQHAMQHTEKTIFVGWLPLFHDMGLIGNVLQPLYLGIPCILMSPVAFLQRPVRWLQAISHYKATTSGGPNFAYELCLSKITNEQRETLDLSTWEVAFNGAEPVRAETLERFATAFEPCGFRREAFYPCYGMAETTLLVSGGLKAALPVFKTVQGDALEQHRVVSASFENEEVRTLVGCGQTLLDQQIVIAHPDTLTRCSPDEVGEIWVWGNSVTQGYWNHPEETQTAFRAYLADTGEGPFLRTGDLGFLQDGELFVTGRLKDLIIIGGRNHYPQDIEQTVEQSHLVLQQGCTAAFSVEVNGQERLVVACEVERTSRRNLDVDAIGKSISQAVIEQHELEVYAILLLKTGSIPKTSSGKIQRRACRAGFLAGNLDVVGDWRTNPESKVESQRRVEEVGTPLQQVLPGKQQQSSSGRTKGSQHDSSNREFQKKAQAIQAWLVSNIAERFRVNPQDIDVQQPFSRYGLDSIAAVSLSGELGDWLGCKLSPTLVYDYPTIEALVPHLVEELATSADPIDVDALGESETEAKDANASDGAIAIIGLGCRFPGASDATAFWQLLRDGVDAITEVPATRWDINALYNSEPATPGKMSTRWGGFLDQVDQFDPHFFAIAPREAERIDPQQRLLLEVAWEALENAGQAPDQLAGSQTGVFIGISSSDYSRLQFEDCDRIDAYTGTGNALSIAANRLSYVLDLRGPSLAVDTACSSSLVAVHLACQSLQNKECNLALAGGVNLILSPELTITFSQARMMATDGRCKTFSADADGYVRGEGCGVVLLKRLSDALRDGDNILAVIKGSAINQDGRSNGITAPNGPSQQMVIRQALENAGVAPAQISYVEAHGTGTSLGDPIEVDSLKAVLMSNRSPNEPCVLGSVKTNIGHLEAAAGIASLIKVVLSLQHGEIPPHLHLNQLNPYISLEDTSFSIPQERHPWLVGAKRRFAGVSSFGFGGTNAHVVVEEPPVPAKTVVDVERPLHLLTLSAKSQKSLQLLAQRYQTFLEAYPQGSIADVCFTANTGRSHFAHRLAIMSESTMQLQELLGAFVNGQQASGLVSGQVPSRNRPKIAFLFTGQGSQYVGMGRQLYETQPTFRQALERCDELLRPYMEYPLLSLLYSASNATDLLHETAYTQPALFALEYALAQLWRSWGIVPDVVMGHSLGEYVAACVAGVFSLEDGLLLVVERSRLMQSLPHDGSMAVVFAPEARVRAAISSYKTRAVSGEEDESDTLALNQTQVAIASGDAIVSIAAVNGPENIVISGAREAVESAIAQLQSQEITVQPLQVSHAFHSPLMAPILDEFERKAGQVNFKAPRIPLISNLTGQMLKPGELPDASYWRRHMRETVQFSAGMNVLEKQGYELFLELGPSATLLGMGKRCLPKRKGLWLPSLKQGQDDWRVLLNSLGVLEIQGVEVNWAGFDQGYQRRRVPLPTYPFERQRYWFESDKQRDGKLMDVKESDTRLSTPQVETTPKITQPDSIRSQLRVIVAGLLHADSAQIDVHAPFLEMGADSLVILEAVRTIETTFGVKIAIRQFFEGLATIDALATYIDKHITPEWALKVYPQPEVKPTVPSQHSAVAVSLGATEDVSRSGVAHKKVEGVAIPKTALERIMAQQLEVMSQQLELLGKNVADPEKSLLTQTALFESLNQTVPNVNNPVEASLPSQITTDASSFSTSGNTEPDQVNAEPILPLRSLKPELNVRLNPDQQRHLEELIARYTKRTQKSKERKQAYHPVLADSRASAGFRPSIKEMLYPIIGQRAKGSRIWDLDGNEYVDITMGFGVQLFGHDAPFITAALEAQMKQGLHLGPQSDLAGEVAELICQMTGVQRVTFCNSGTEAVMTALRLARTATCRTKIALFSGSYHGHFDGVLAKAQTVDGNLRSVPIAPGIAQNIVEDVLVLDYGNPQSLEILQRHAHELAAVLVEPVQSRRPDLQPKAFLQQLRQLTATAGTALIFDEIITGFRIHPGGAQAWFGIEADLVTYGKVIGGGLPIGVVAGKATYMNGIDGGLWNYGDASSPHAETTFFAGTFNKHPLTMATALAVLKHLKEHSPAIQQQLNQRTSQLAETLNTYFQAEDVPLRIVYFSSLFRFTFSGNLDLFFYHLLEKGVYIWEGRNCFLSAAHTDADVNYVIEAVKDSIDELRKGGFLSKGLGKLPEVQKGLNGSSSSLTKLIAPTDAVLALASLTTLVTTQERVAKDAKKVPLSEAQKQLWFLTQIGDEGSLAYNVYTSIQLKGSFRLRAMCQAVQRLVERHEALRTIISDQGDFQEILPYLKVDVPLIDFSSVDSRYPESEVADWFRQESQEPFDLRHETPFRIHILKLKEHLHLLVLTAHHILIDGWSMGVILQELGSFYTAECQGTICQLEPAKQFREYIEWQEQQSQTEEMATHEPYWLEKFANSIPLLYLPTDRPRSLIKTYRGSRQTIQIDAKLCRDVKRFSVEKGCTLFMTLLSAYTLLLYRLTGQDDLVVGIPVAGRSLKGSEKLVGYCTHLLPLRSCVVGRSTFSEHLTMFRKLLLDAYDHQDYPFARLLDKLKGSEDISMSPIVTSTFNLDRPVAVPEMFELETELFPSPISFTGLDLSLNVFEINSELELSCDYNPDLFNSATIEHLLGHFQTILTGIVANPQQQVSEFPMLTVAERHQLLVEWNDTYLAFPQDLCIHQLFEAQVEQTPDAVAVVFEDKQLTYRELNCRANQLAHHLQALGVKPEVLVGICIERSLEMVIGLLGILKAGGAYVPLDPAYPSERLTFMLEDSQAPVLLTQQHIVGMLPKSRTHVVYLDVDWEAIALHSLRNPTSSVTGNNLAYAIYTSGSTGKPKGVQILHSAVVNFLTSMRRCPGLTNQDTLLSVTTLSFGIVALELFLPLSVGARLVMVSRQVANDGTQLLERLNYCGATVMQATPATWRLLLAAGWSRSHQLKILCGGEVLSRELANQLLDKGASLWNLYGPTEATIWSTIYQVDNTDGTVSIGHPIANTQIYLLDEHLQPVPVGVPGELYIGGAGLARGYLNRPELTAQKFIANPLSQEPSARLYKTGDLARYQSDGNIEYLGRIDHQVKVRGFRIELGEIEVVLSQHPVVQQSVVIVREDIPDNQHLVAYLVLDKEQATPTASELRHFLKQQLPKYMVPSAFVTLDSLPLTPNGKIDRRTLPAPDTTFPFEEEAYVAPQTPVEELLAGIWADILAVKQVSIHDNFFDLGGHSLRATQLISRLRDTFCVEFPLRGLFESPTVASLSERLEALLRTEQGLVAPPLLPVEREGELPLSFAQARLWFLEQLEPGSWAYNMPAAVRLTGSLDVAALEQSLNEIVQRHETLRTTFAMVSGEPIQVIAPVLALTLPLVDLRELLKAQQEAEVERLATEEAQQPFDLAMGPLLRATLLHLGEAENVLLLTMHHIASDGWSIGVLIRELAALYEAFSTGKPSPLPQLPIQYVDFAHWQRQWLQGEVLAAQLSYWQQQLAGAQTVLELPTDRPRPTMQTFAGATQFLVLPEPLSQKLKALSRRSGVTLFMTLLAAFQTLLYRYTGQDDICIGSPIANRNRSETEELIGFFVNTLVLRTDMSKNPSFQELLFRVREVTLGAYAHQDLPFEQLVEALQPERNLSHQPLFQVMFVLQNAPMPALELPDLTLSSLERESSTATFDLTMSMEDTEQRLSGSLEYNTDLFDAATISRMLEHFQTLLEGIVANPEQQLSDLPLLTQPERQQLLVEWNNTQVAYPKDVCVHQLFEAQAEQTPEAVALVFEDQQLTYGELNRRANQVAHHVRSLGVRPDVLVGLCVERSLEMVVGLLGILKAGGAYVPLDPDYPSERLAYMLNDSQMPVLVTTQKLSTGLPEHQARVVCLNQDWGINSPDSDLAPVSGVKAENLAYVIYTSGSTGKPKGVAIAHRSLVNAYLAWEDAYQLHSLCRSHLQMASFSFDVFSGDLVRALCSGAKLVICPREWLLEPENLYELMLQEKIDCAEFVPAVLRNLIQYLERTKQDLSFMRLLIAGSDSWHIKEYQQFQRFCSPQTRLINSYGATEATIDSSYFERTALSFSIDGLVPIGRPFANTQIYILDSHLQPVPVGFAGEVHIGGAGVARSYLNQPKLTEQKFVPNPFSNNSGDRLYKTGDLGRYLPDGTIEFLGRLDDQVKIRGFRIELGEIEAVLGQHPAVDETVVVVREDVPGNKRLVGYVVVNETSAPTVSQMHQFLKQKLLEYMIPSAIVKLEALPLTPNGKVDRRALLALDTGRPELQSAFVAPRDTLELQLAQIWEDVLKVRPIGVTDNFFTLGGHSLLAVRLMALLQQQFEQNLPLATLFLAPTIEHLASTLGQPTNERQWSPLVKIQSGGSKRPFFCVPGSGGNVIYFYHLARHLGSDQPFYGLQARGLDGEQMPHTQVEDMAAYYIEALQTIQPQGPYLLGGHSFGSYVAFEMALQLLHQGQEVALLAILDTPAPLPTNKPGDVEHDDDARYLTDVAMTIEQLVGKKLSVSYEHLQPLAPNEQLNYILERLKTVNFFPPEAKLGQLRGLVQVFKANHQTHYVPHEVYPNQITVFPASEQFYDDPAMGWDQVSSEPVETYSVPGDHITMVTEPHVRVLAEKLRACLDKAQADDERK